MWQIHADPVLGKVQEGDTLSIQAGSFSSPIIASYSTPLTGSNFELAFHIDESSTGSAFFGFAPQSRVHPGYRCSLVAYGGPGNLANGGALLRGRFGPAPKGGDTVRFKVAIGGGRVKVWLMLNEKPLGLAYDVPDTDIVRQGDPILAVVSVSEGPMKVTLRNPATLPPFVDSISGSETEGVSGTWNFEQFKGRSLEPLHPTITIKANPDGAYTVAITVANILRTTLQPTAGNLVARPFISTLMMGLPEAMDLENEMKTFFSSIKSIQRVTEKGAKVVITNSDGETATLSPHFEPHVTDLQWRPL